MKDSSYKSVRVDHCVPLFLSRTLSLSGVQRLKANIVNSWRESDGESSGIVSGTATVIIIPLQERDKDIVSGYVESRMEYYKADEDAQQSSSQWYGIVDGCHRHAALMEVLCEYKEDWKDFHWTATCLRGRLPFERCRQLQRSQNQLHDEKYKIETTIFDLLDGLRQIYDKLKREQSIEHRGARPLEVKHQLVAELYDGAPHPKRDSIRQAVSVASRISRRAIEAIGTVVKDERPSICFEEASINTSGMKRVEDIMESIDCRVYRSFVKWSSLRASTPFMNALSSGEEEAQVNTIFRLKSWCSSNSYRTAQSSDVTRLFQLAVHARKEDRKFCSFIKQPDWPSAMKGVRDDLHRTVRYDSEIESNIGNDTEVLPSILQCYRQLFRKEFEEIQRQLHRSAGSERVDGDVDNPESPRGVESSCVNNIPNDSQSPHRDLMDLCDSRMKSIDLCSKADKNLSECGITLLNKTWREFLREDWNEKSEKVDLVFTQVPRPLHGDHQRSITNSDDLSRGERDEFAQMLKQCVKEGSYIFIITSSDSFPTWKGTFQAAGFMVMSSPFVIVYDQDTISKRKVLDFPQKDTDLAILAKTPGVHPSGFRPDFNVGESATYFEGFSCYGSLRSVAKTHRRLMKMNGTTPLRSSEMEKRMVQHLIDMLAPPGGLVMDPFGGAFEVALAALEKKRRCISMEKDEDCFQHAVSRVRLSVTPDTTLENLSEFMAVFDESAAPLDDNISLTDDPISFIDSQLDAHSSLTGVSKKRLLHSTDALDPIVPTRQKRTCAPDGILGNNIQGGTKVLLIIDGNRVGRATVSQPLETKDADLYVQSLHGTDLNQFGEIGELLVVVTKIQIFERFKTLPYPYFCPGPEESPSVMGDLFSSGVYSWDLHKMCRDSSSN